MNILVIEDDPSIAANLVDYLAAQGYEVDSAPDGVTGLHLAVRERWSAILLDLGLPGMDGITLCRRLREEARCTSPILMLTAKDTLEEKLDGFTAGADDYLVKPFSLREVGARLAALIKRDQGQVAPAVLQCAGIRLDPLTHEVARNGRPIRLPPKCLGLLQTMMQAPGRVFRRAELEVAVWGEPLQDSDTLRSHVRVLRRALCSGDEADPIETVHGFGYRILNDAG